MSTSQLPIEIETEVSACCEHIVHERYADAFYSFKNVLRLISKSNDEIDPKEYSMNLYIIIGLLEICLRKNYGDQWPEIGNKLEHQRTMEAVVCSFCGKNKNDVKTVIAGPEVYICDECVVLCNSVLKDKGID